MAGRDRDENEMAGPGDLTEASPPPEFEESSETRGWARPRPDGAASDDGHQEPPKFGSRIRAAENRLAEDLREAAEHLVEEQRLRAADRARVLAEALRHAAGELEQQESALFARYAGEAADGIETWSDALRQRHISELVDDAESFARRRPELFLAGAAAAGFLLGRFLKASGGRGAEDRLPSGIGR